MASRRLFSSLLRSSLLRSPHEFHSPSTSRQFSSSPLFPIAIRGLSQSEALTRFESNNGLLSELRSSRLPLLQQTAMFGPSFCGRFMSTATDSIGSSSEDIPDDPLPDVPPRIKFKRLDKTGRHIMQILNKEAVEEVRTQREIPDIKPGYIVELKVEVPENKRRVSIIKGIVIARRNAGINTTFRIRRLVAGVGIESLFPLWCETLMSFDYPCDTYIPGMKIGKNLVTGFETFTTSWKSGDDPAPGKYTLYLDTHGWPQVFIKNGVTVVSRLGSWNGLEFTGDPGRPVKSIVFEFTYSESEVYVGYQLKDGSALARDVLHPSGDKQLLIWVNRIQNWAVSSTTLSSQCEIYAWCGAYGACNANNFPVCECLTGFSPKSPKDWNNGNWFTGCERRTNLNCHDDGFFRYAGVKLPNTSSSFFSETMNLQECGQLCLSKCSCTAYANLYVDGSGCLLWFADLVDIVEYSKGGQDLYVRVAASEIDGVEKMGRSNKKKKLAAIIVGSGVLSMIIILFLGRLTNKRRDSRIKREKVYGRDYRYGQRQEDVDLPTFDFQTIANATGNFSSDNKVGEGGFGPVYKGTLIDGQEIAVKRLSVNSCQGLNELKNEVNIIIAKLQHRNLVKLFGCCLQEEEKILVYEYMPNKSLDSFIFDQTRSKLLDWPTRMHIIVGIARGLLYLHQDSRLRIVHRDLKASNILLDANMNPKISDFGLAKAFGGDQTEARTNRIVGTHGYMSPEYAVHGKFSVKSDVFSFGVLALEILSGKKNRDFSDPNHNLNLLGHSWRLWVEKRHLQLIDDSLSSAADATEIMRCIHIALLCVQQSPEERPDMLSVVVMLTSDSNLPKPKQPGFYVDRNLNGKGFPEVNQKAYSENEVTTSLVEAR
ncbi:hypothetical protein PIB30_029133 [Stylosanthes scabra]|uniref:Non-specific serine/threonine protein kinase n=1 Tax=Stylosanthes scabra TaxID=79078 RepID=A0ABU6WBF8_9FABA|nr:hypothetical protein [Stylosanthes scabra]